LPLISATMGVDDEILDSQELLDLNIVEFPNQQAYDAALQNNTIIFSATEENEGEDIIIDVDVDQGTPTESNEAEQPAQKTPEKFKTRSSLV